MNGKHDMILDTEDSDYREGTINGCEAYFNTKNSDSSIAWMDDNMIYNLYGNIEMSELKTMAENIKNFLTRCPYLCYLFRNYI
ncbi:DUF4367 domain-containing protein [Agathobaculum sp. Marseille-P7918]|uniref:DUF4367 domain-containing protein n=1 Tax=Agathobaculum sp. Marseille-P7918 TaxID=2479843 RepID=UPI003566E574